MQHLSITTRERDIRCFENIDGQEQQVTFNLTPTGLRAFENYLVATLERMHVTPIDAPAHAPPRASETSALYIAPIALDVLYEDLGEW